MLSSFFSHKNPSDAKTLRLDLLGFVACTKILVSVEGQGSLSFFGLAGLSAEAREKILE